MTTNTTSSFFETVELLPEDSILSIPIAYKADNRPRKVNLGVGSYRDALGNPYPLVSVRDAELILHKQQLDKEYLPIIGDKQFLDESLKLIFGADDPKIKTGEICAFQTPGGTGAVRIGLEFLYHMHNPVVYLPNFTWPNHDSICKQVGLKYESYPYYNIHENSLDFANMCHAITKMPSGSVVMLHVCCHNPTGEDPSIDQWKQLSRLIKEQHLIPYLDFAYQGFGEDFVKDAAPVRIFSNDGHEMFVAYSYSKNLGLYGERVGCLAVIAQQPAQARKVESQIKVLIRSSYSNPPAHGSRIASLILANSQLRIEWEHELKNMRDRLAEMRDAFAFGLETKLNHVDFRFLKKQKGFFSLIAISPEKVKQLRDEHAIYMPPNGRISFAGINMDNMDYVIDVFGKALRT